MSFVSIIVPTLNEADNIDILVKRIHSVAWPDGVEYEIIFSDSCSGDATCERVERWMQHNGDVHLVHNPKGAGLSSAVLRAVAHAKGNFVVVIDADLSHPPEKIPEVLGPLLTDTADMVIGSRYVKGGQTPDWPFYRKISSLLATLPARLLTDVKDPLAGFIAVRKDLLMMLDHEIHGFKFGLELLATGEGEIRVAEVPITFRDRCLGASKMNAKVISDYFLQLLQLAGIQLAPGGLTSIMQVMLLFFVVDSISFTVLIEQGLNPTWFHWLSFGLASAAAFTWWRKVRCSKVEDSVSPVAKEQFLGLLWVALLSVCLRSGIVAALARDGMFNTVEIFFVTLAGTGTCYIGTVFYVLSLGKKRIRGTLVHRFYAIGIICYLLLLRLVYCGAVRLLPEEQYYTSLIGGTNSLSEMFYLPVTAMTGSLFFQLFDGAPLGFRLGGWVAWLVAAVFIFSFARDLYNRSAGFKVLLVYSILPFFFGTGLFLTGDSLLTMFWCGTVYTLYRALMGSDITPWLWAGLIIGFGVQVNWLVLSFIPAILIFLAIFGNEDKKQFRNALVGAAVMAVSFIPGYFLHSEIPQYSLFAGKYWIESILGTTVAHSFVLAGVLLAPTGLIAGLLSAGGWLRLSEAVTYSAQQEPRKNRVYILVIFCFTLFFSLLPGDFATRGSVYAASIAWIVLLPTISLCAADFLRVHALGILRFLHGAWWPTVVLCVTAYAVLLHLAVV